MTSLGGGRNPAGLSPDGQAALRKHLGQGREQLNHPPPNLNSLEGGSKVPTVTRLASGFVLVRWSAECWAQIPAGFDGEVIPDEYIFAPLWNSERVNAWWRSHRASDPRHDNPPGGTGGVA